VEHSFDGHISVRSLARLNGCSDFGPVLLKHSAQSVSDPLYAVLVIGSYVGTGHTSAQRFDDLLAVLAV